MADFTAPSFSLGLDFDLPLAEESVPKPAAESPINVSSQSFEEDTKDDEDFHAETLDPGSPPVLKRLRRGRLARISSISERESTNELSIADDDIEEFSSDDVPQKAEPSSRQSHLTCSSSKYSLQSQRILTQSSSKSKMQKNTPASNASTITSLEASSNKQIFPKLTISPLRRFQLLDSDTDEPSSCENQPKTVKQVEVTKERTYTPTQSMIGNQQNKAKISSNAFQAKSFWKDFSPVKITKMQMPALDEFYDPSSHENQPKKVNDVDECAKERKHTPTHSVTKNRQKRAEVSSTILKTETFCKDFPMRNKKVQTPASDEYCEPSSFEKLPKYVKKSHQHAKERTCNPTQPVTEIQQKRAKESSTALQSESFWKDFTPMKDIKLQTPALDEFCEEHFRSVKDNNASEGREGDMRPSSSKSLARESCLDEMKGCFLKHSICEDTEQCDDQPYHHPPAYKYFYHNDPRIQKSIRHRLPNFFPIGAVGHRGHKQCAPASIDYMGQFGHTGDSVKAPAQGHGSGKKGHEGSLRKSKKNMNHESAQEMSQVSGNWVNPKSCAAIPRDAGKRRVHADGHSAGHWYTGQDGRKVYVTKKGQELMGRLAYRQYRKESGLGMGKSRKKAATKKRSKH